ncbi:MAG: replication-associated recombination protein A [Planctomycetota bacterium]|jgi:putative ATPase
MRYNAGMSDLWAQKREDMLKTVEPLAVRMRPRSLDEFTGQRHFLSEGKLLRRMLEADRLTSVIFYGPPGVGKTTLAEVIAGTTDRHFERANAATIGVKEVRFVIDDAIARLADTGRKTILFLDEIHRFSRSQQDVLLRDMERGTITLIGATTENPFFAVNSPLISRSQVFQFEPLSEDDIRTLLRSALEDDERGYGQLRLDVTDEALDHWAVMCDGDARRALTALEIAVLSSTAGGDPRAPVVIDRDVAAESIQRKAIEYDPTGDSHYDAISAFIKSMRGSDPDAAVYWLARMLTAGEDPRFIARRIAILASEDIGNADPRAILVADAAFSVTERIGMPECQLTLGQAAIYMATAPKSNASARAIWDAMSDVKENRTLPVPKHLRDGHYAGAKELGHAQGYQYAHKGAKGWVEQDYLGVDRVFYEPSNRGHEQHIRRFLEWLKAPAEGGADPSGDQTQEKSGSS